MSEEKTPEQRLITAVRENDFAQLKSLIAAGVNISQRVNGDTALGECVHRGRYEMAKYLLEHGADPEIPDDGVTPLKMARDQGQEKIAQLLEKLRNVELAKEIPEWSLLGNSKLVHVEVSPAIGRKLTEIFNFESRERLTCWENLKTGAETILPVTKFDDIPEPSIDAALKQFKALDGSADTDYALRGTKHLDKPRHI